MSNITYKQIITYFSSIAYHHEQINSFGVGDYTQLVNNINTKETRKYTAMYIVPEMVEFNENHIYFNFNVVIADQIYDDLSNQRDVMSDTLQIAQDVWTIFYQSYTQEQGDFSDTIMGDWDATVEPFLEITETVLGGHTLHIKMSIPFDYTECGLPIDPDYSFPQDQSFSSYEQIVNDWEQFSMAHEQIRSFGFGDITQLVDDNETKQSPLYPRLYFIPDTSTLAPNHLHIKWRVIICDIVDDDLSNQVNIWSDTLEIAKDFYSKAYLSDYEVDWDASLEPWFQKTETVLAGWEFIISVNQKYDYNRCILPTTSFINQLTWEEVMELLKNVDQKWKSVKKEINI